MLSIDTVKGLLKYSDRQLWEIPFRYNDNIEDNDTSDEDDESDEEESE